jgi:co-chaperonin GroES (HSP10)
MQALHHFIIIEKDQAPERIGLIYVPTSDDADSPPYTGTIISAGTKVEDPDLVPGTRVAYVDLSSTPLEIDGKTCVLIESKNITAVIE